jgi:hypothetical protein
MDFQDKIIIEEFLKGSYYAFLVTFYRETIKDYRYNEIMPKNEARHRIRLLNEFHIAMDLSTLGPRFFSDPDDAPLFNFDLQKKEAEQNDNVILFDLAKRGD